MILISLVLLLFVNSGLGSPPPATAPPAPQSASELSIKLQSQIDTLSTHLEKFNEFYLTTLEQKMTAILTVVTALDGNIQSLHEKAHTWSIFRHNIEAWSDHMKSVDHKIDLIKRTQDEYQSIEAKLNSLEYAINHILAKVNKPDEKTKNVDNTIEEKITAIHKIVENCKHSEANDKEDINNKLSSILKHIMSLKQGHFHPSRNMRNAYNKPIYRDDEDTIDFLREIESKLDDLIERISSREFVSADNTNTQSNDNIMDVLRRIDDRTIQMYNEGNNHNSKLMSCCRSTSNELATFTDSADILLKRIERLLMIVQNKVEKRKMTISRSQDDEEHDDRFNEEKRSTKQSISAKNKEILDDDEYHEDVEEVFASTEPVRRFNAPMKRVDEDATEASEDYSSEVQEYAEFNQPSKNGCHDVQTRVDGIYKFSSTPDTNAVGRDFNERLCVFPTDGLGWTVIQNRGPFEIQENFNRSWYDYKNGFGDLRKDFWFGNEFIRSLVAENPFELRIELEDFDGVQVWAEYSVFQINSEEHNYRITLSGFRGAVADSMLYHHNNEFSTYDRRNDKSLEVCCPCAPGYGSGWWFDNCSEANLNGIYRKTPYGHNFIGIIWEHWHGDYSLRKTKMLIRPKDVSSSGTEEPVDSFSDLPEDP